MKIKLFLLFFILFGPLFLHAPSAYAAKKFVPKTGTRTSTVRRTSGGGLSIPASVKYRGDKLGIYLSFPNFSGIESADYAFTYTGNGVAQGAGGTIRSSNDPSAQRELLFGTCSSGVCTYHHNLTNARLVLTAHFSNGRVASKLFKIRTYQ